MSCRCTGIMPAMDDDYMYPRSPLVQSGPDHAGHCCCSLAPSSAFREGEGAEVRGGAGRALRRLSEQRVWWLWPTACRRGSGRPRGPSPARIWTAIRHVGVRHPSESGWQERGSLYLRRPRHCSASRRPHSLMSTECGRRASASRIGIRGHRHALKVH